MRTDDTLPTDDERLGLWCAALELERHAYWTSGDRARDWLDDIRAAVETERLTPRQARKERRRVLGLMAKAAGQGMTLATIQQRARVCATFPDDVRPTQSPGQHGDRAMRYLDLPPTFYRATMNAAERTQRDALELLEEAIDRGLTVGDLNALGKDVPIELVASGDCPKCGATVRVKIVGTPAARAEVHQLTLPCPTCVALAWLRGTDGREADHIGALA